MIKVYFMLSTVLCLALLLCYVLHKLGYGKMEFDEGTDFLFWLVVVFLFGPLLLPFVIFRAGRR